MAKKVLNSPKSNAMSAELLISGIMTYEELSQPTVNETDKVIALALTSISLISILLIVYVVFNAPV